MQANYTLLFLLDFSFYFHFAQKPYSLRVRNLALKEALLGERLVSRDKSPYLTEGFSETAERVLVPEK